MGKTRVVKLLEAIASGNTTSLPNPVTALEKALKKVAMAGWQNGVQSDWNELDDTQADFIKNKPTIPDAQVQADWDETDETSMSFINNKPDIAKGSADGKKILLNSSTSESTKVFEITVTDDGTLSATEVTG